MFGNERGGGGCRLVNASEAIAKAGFLASGHGRLEDLKLFLRRA
jgi:hypothetical protein